MIYSRAGLELTESFEGCKFTAYPDSGGVWTIGYGHTKGVTEGMACSLEQAIEWLMEDVEEAEAAVNRLVKVPLTQGEFDALVDFVFNLGEKHFAESTLLRLLNEGDFVGAAEQFERWDKCDGKEVAGLLRRRLAEETEFKGINNAGN